MLLLCRHITLISSSYIKTDVKQDLILRTSNDREILVMASNELDLACKVHVWSDMIRVRRTCNVTVITRNVTRNYARNITRNYAHFTRHEKAFYLIFITPDQLNPSTLQQASKEHAWQRLYWTQTSKNKAVIKHSYVRTQCSRFWRKTDKMSTFVIKNIGAAVLISYIDTTTAMIMRHEDDDAMATKQRRLHNSGRDDNATPSTQQRC